MKILLAILAIFAIIFGMHMIKPREDIFETYKAEWGKHYLSNDVEEYRRTIFMENVARIEEHNATPGITYREGINQFTDLTGDEFAATYLTLQVERPSGEQHVITGEGAQDVDWVAKGAVSAVKDQGSCGSCWAFSAVGGMEGLNFLYGSKKMELFSEQMLVDCSKSYGNHGCQGGLMTNAYKFVHDKGIKLESEYPYTARDGACKFQEGQFKIEKYVEITNCDAQADALVKQPIAVAADASRWSSYKDGIFSNCGTNLNHGITLVALKVADGYWKIKNSWGTRWGEQGFMRIKYPGSTCGLCKMSCYPLGPSWK